jgi:hypothetical protein
MSVRMIGPETKMGTLPVGSGATVTRNQFARVASGVVVAMADGSNANLVVALDKFPDVEYEGTKARVDFAYLGEDQEIEVPFSAGVGGIVAANIGAADAFRITAAGVVNLESTTNGVFIIRRLGRDTKLTDTTGFVVGVVTDAASF